MKEVTTKTYIADDGKEFTTKAACEEYEKDQGLDVERELGIKELNNDVLTILSTYNPEARFYAFTPKSKENMDKMEDYVLFQHDMKKGPSDRYVEGHKYIAVLDWEASDTVVFIDYTKFCNRILRNLRELDAEINN